MQEKKQIFSNIKILDFTQVIAGSYGTTMMGDMGATVVKVEPTIGGDTLRFAGPMHNEESGFFLLNNRNKKSISIDLKKNEGIQIVKQLIPHFDVITENFKPGVMEKLGLAYQQVKTIKDDIIYASVSGHGHNNDYSDLPAYDNIIQATTGIASLNGLPEDNCPLRNPLSVSDYVSGIYSAFAISSAIYHRQNSGKGQHIDIAMYDALISIMDNTFLIYHMNRQKIEAEIAKNPQQKDEILKEWGLKSTGNRHPGAAPHSYFKTTDGHIAHMSLTNEMWNKLLKVIGREDLINDPRYDNLEKRKTRWRETDEIIELWSYKRSSAEVIKIFQENRLPCGKVRTIDEVYQDPHNALRGVFQEIEHPIAGKIDITNIPIKMSETPPQIHSPSPTLGQHNYEILSSFLGYTSQMVEELTEKKILFSR